MLSLNLYKEDFDVVQNNGCFGRILRTIIVLFLALYIGLLFENNITTWLVFTCITFGGSYIADIYIRKLYPDWPKKRNFTGKLIISQQNITINSEKRNLNLLISECKELIFFFDQYSGYSAGGPDLQRNGNALVFFKNNNGVVSTAKFNINSYKEFEDFKLILADYKKSVNYFKEYIPREISVILKPDLSDRIIYN